MIFEKKKFCSFLTVAPVLIFHFSGFVSAVLKAPVASCPPGASQKTLDGNHTPVVFHTDTHSRFTSPEDSVCDNSALYRNAHTHTFWTRRTGRIQGF